MNRRARAIARLLLTDLVYISYNNYGVSIKVPVYDMIIFVTRLFIILVVMCTLLKSLFSSLKN